MLHTLCINTLPLAVMQCTTATNVDATTTTTDGNKDALSTIRARVDWRVQQQQRVLDGQKSIAHCICHLTIGYARARACSHSPNHTPDTYRFCAVFKQWWLLAT